MGNNSTNHLIRMAGIVMSGIFLQQPVCAVSSEDERPNFIVIFTDDHRWDSLGVSGDRYTRTPNLDKLAAQGTYFPNTFVTLSICSPSRAALLTGRYGSANGVMDVTVSGLKESEVTLADFLNSDGYTTAVTGKWHLPNSPESLGFDFARYFEGIVHYWNVTFKEGDKEIPTKGFVEERTVDASLEFLDERDHSKPFFLWVNTFAPHMEANFSWSPTADSLYSYSFSEAPVPSTWQGDYKEKPPYLASDRAHKQALYYGYADPDAIRVHARQYAASVTDMDASIGRLLEEVQKRGLSDNTYIIVMGDNGWFLGEHGLTSKVLAYEDSMRVPFIIKGPGIKPSQNENLVLNIDVLPTVLEFAGLPIPDNVHGKSIIGCLDSEQNAILREAILYEAFLSPEEATHQIWPHYAIRTYRWKYIATYHPRRRGERVFEELYDLRSDPVETENLAANPDFDTVLNEMRAILLRKRSALAANP